MEKNNIILYSVLIISILFIFTNNNNTNLFKNSKFFNSNNKESNPTIPENAPYINIRPDNKIKKFNKDKYFNDPNIHNSYTELLSMSNSMINIEPYNNNRTNNINENVLNPRYEDFSSIDDTLVLPNYESNYVNQPNFPENTSDVLPNFNADNVAQIYAKDNITDLYNTINTDIYKRYKTYNLV